MRRKGDRNLRTRSKRRNERRTRGQRIREKRKGAEVKRFQCRREVPEVPAVVDVQTSRERERVRR